MKNLLDDITAPLPQPHSCGSRALQSLSSEPRNLAQIARAVDARSGGATVNDGYLRREVERLTLNDLAMRVTVPGQRGYSYVLLPQGEAHLDTLWTLENT